MNNSDIAKMINRKEIDINNQSPFFGILYKGLLWELHNKISVRNIPVPHFIPNTGDETMALQLKGQNRAIEPGEVSNEDYIYTIIPRCAVSIKGIDIEKDQLSSPHACGNFQFQYDDVLGTYAAEVRRLPITANVDLEYVTDSFTDYLSLVQQIISKLTIINTFYISYMGMNIECSYEMPDSMEDENMVEFDEATTDDRRHKIDISLKISTNIPIYDAETVIPADRFYNPEAVNIEGEAVHGVSMGLYPKGQLTDEYPGEDPHAPYTDKL